MRACLSLLAFAPLAAPLAAQPPALASLAERETLRLVVTDSGMGGLSVAADIAARAQAIGTYREVEIIFANALFRPEAGYNSLPTREEKIAVFNSALEAMDARHDPDAILVACNTLSVLLPDCPVVQRGETLIEGIVDVGVEMVATELEANPGATALLFATPTTVEEQSHLQGLLARGVEAPRVVVQPCADLTWNIEQDPSGFETEMLISFFVTEALGKRADAAAPVVLSFNCTHFGYSRALWEKELRGQGAELVATVDPNSRLADPLFPAESTGRFADPVVTASVLSMVDIPPQTVEALAPVLEATSPAVAQSLRDWEKAEDLFDWQSHVAGAESAP